MTDRRCGSTLGVVGTNGTSADAPDRVEPFAWLSELIKTTPGLIEAYVPGSGGIDARARERIHVAVARADEARLVAWVHQTWSEFIGPGLPDDGLVAVHGFALASSRSAVPLDAGLLELGHAPGVVRSARATVALARLGTGMAKGLVGLVPTSRRWSVRGFAPNATAVAAALPVLPMLTGFGVVAGSMRLVSLVAPPIPEPVLSSDEDANLVVHLLVDSLSTFLGNVVVRMVLVWSPFVLSLGVRADGAAATLRIGQGRIEVSNGISPDALIVVDGGIEPLLSLAANSILHQLVAEDDTPDRRG